MARPSKFNRSEAVEIVMNEIWLNGYEASSVKSLSEKLGITRSSFYNAFGSREELFKEVLEVYFKQSPDLALAIATPGTPIKKLLTNTFHMACKVRASDELGRGCMAINSVSELCNVNDDLGPVLQSAVLGNLARFETLLQGGVAQGEIEAETDLHALALALQNLLIGLNILCKVVGDEDELWKAAKTTLVSLDLYEE